MTTKEVATRLVELCRQGKLEDTLKELYSEDAVSIEANDSMGPKTTEGLAGIFKKSEQFNSMVEELHSAEISEPVVSDNHFSISWDLDATMKGHGRSRMSEICVYKVADGKIVSEQFFY